MRNKELFRGRRKAGRIVGLVLTLALAVSLLSGCGQSKERLTFGTGGTAGTYYSYGGVLAQYITNNTFPPYRRYRTSDVLYFVRSHSEG